MSEGYGFGAEGDWKTAALVRILKVMSRINWGYFIYGGLHLSFGTDKSYVLGSHMLENCPSICGKTKCDSSTWNWSKGGPG